MLTGPTSCPPHHRSAKGQTMQKKRLVLCVSAHLSPFHAMVFEQHYAAMRASGQKKHFLPKDPFDYSKNRAKKVLKRESEGNGGKLTRAEQLAAAESARLRLDEALRATEAAKKESDAVKAAAIAAAKRREAAAAAAVKEAAGGIAAPRFKAAADAASAAAGPAGARKGGIQRGPCARRHQCPCARSSGEVSSCGCSQCGRQIRPCCCQPTLLYLW